MAVNTEATNCVPLNVVQEDEKPITPREYQIEILEAAKKQNTIACLGTGTGKTFIAVLLIREMAHHVEIPFADGGKRVFFLVPTVPLVDQQAQFIGKHTELKVKGYIGEMNLDIWSKEDWLKEFESHQILVMTGEICRAILDHYFLPVSRICLLILDECHQTRGNSPYSQIMNLITESNEEFKPRIFGLSASLVNDKCKPQNLEREVIALEQKLQSKVVTATDYEDVLKYGSDARECNICYHGSTIAPEYSDIVRRMSDLQNELKLEGQLWNETAAVGIKGLQRPEQCISHVINILKTMGPWCAQRAAKMLCNGVEKKINCADEQNLNRLDKVKNILQEFILICDECIGDHFNENLNTMPHKLQRLIEILKQLQKKCNTGKECFNQFSKVNFAENPYLYAQKLKVLKSNTSNLMCGIIFVEQRIGAYALCQWLQHFVEVNEEFSNIKPDLILGQSTSSYEAANEFCMSASKQKSKIKQFRDREFNLLISTSVLEEGLDVQKCNFVIRYDFPKNFKSYIQSKGRARARGSYYILLLQEENRLQFATDLSDFKSIEAMLRNISSTPEESVTFQPDDALVPPYMPVVPGPRITLSSAIGVVYRYCVKLPCDLATKLMPHFAVEEVDCNSVKKEFICTLYFPINSLLHEPIVGQKMQTKKHAKMIAALEACKKLHIIGELDDHLLPVSKAVDTATNELGVLEEETVAAGEGQPGTNKRKQYYKKGSAKVLKNSLPTADMPCYLHVFVLDLDVPLPTCLNPRKKPIVDPAHTAEGFGILLTKKLPKVCKFPIFTESGRILVDIKYIEQSFTFDQRAISNIAKFHQFVFSDTLWITKPCMDFCPELSEFACYVVPVNKDQMDSYYPDMNIITATLTHDYNEIKNMISEQVPRKRFKTDMFAEAIVTKSYLIDKWKTEKPVFHYISKIEQDINPLSYLSDNKSLRFKEYYKNKYNVDIIDDYQPLLDVHRCQSLHMWKPIYVSVGQVFKATNKPPSKRKLDHEGFREYLVPELCIIHPLPDPLYRKATYIPTILFRLNCLLVAGELRHEINEVALEKFAPVPESFDLPIFNLETSDKKLREYLISNGHVEIEKYQFLKEPSKDILKDNDGNICSFEAKADITNPPGPNPSLLLQALTTKSVNDEFNLERLETIGDSFLKYAVSVKLCAKYPLFDEGKLTEVRMKLIRNVHLYQLSKKKGLPEAMVHSPFCCDSQRINREESKDKKNPVTWLPPCFTIQELGNDELGLNDEEDFLYSHQCISDKCVADSVEALIGAYLLSCGHQGALRFMWWLGVNPFMEPEDDEEQKIDFENWPPKAPSPLRREISQVQNMKNLLNFKEFEERIGYTFQQPAYLLQAFTHASYGMQCNDITDCYQRLEFLGDAVLDYLVTRMLYEGPHEHTPGQLTDLRSALVNNAYFASLAVKYGYHKNLRSLSITLGKLIDQFVCVLEDSEATKQFEEYGYYLEETECLDIEEVEIPKALGDIFESVAGAIYLDSGSSLDAVWRIYYPMMKPAIDHMSIHMPISPVRELYELTNEKDIFKDVQKVDDKTYIRVKLQDGQEFVGVGCNKKVAKKSAAKKAVSYFKKKQMEHRNSNICVKSNL